MSIGETRALPCESIQMRRGNLRVGVVAAEVAVAEVIGEDVDDVGAHRLGGVRGERSKRGKREREKDETGRFHGGFRNRHGAGDASRGMAGLERAFHANRPERTVAFLKALRGVLGGAGAAGGAGGGDVADVAEIGEER